MNLPPKTLNVLATIKAELLSHEPIEPVCGTVDATPICLTAEGRAESTGLPKKERERKPRERKPTTLMRYARQPRGHAFQAACRRRDFFAPTY